MFNQIPLGGLLSAGHVVKVLEKRFPYVEVSSILGADSSYDTNRKVRKWRNERTPLPFLFQSFNFFFFFCLKNSILAEGYFNRYGFHDMLVSAGAYLTSA